jgi:hypothetical protein
VSASFYGAVEIVRHVVDKGQDDLARVKTRDTNPSSVAGVGDPTTIVMSIPLADSAHWIYVSGFVSWAVLNAEYSFGSNGKEGRFLLTTSLLV